MGIVLEDLMPIARERVCKMVDSLHREIVDFTRAMIQTPSVYGHEADVQARVMDRLRGIGLEVDTFIPDVAVLEENQFFTPLDAEGLPFDYENRPNVVGILKGYGTGGRSLILNGHCDVVDPGPEWLWSGSPWDGRFENGLIHGRGASDMKAGLCAMICAVEAIVRAGIYLSGDVIVESVVGEEECPNGSLACILRGYTADGAIIAEPTSDNVCVAHRGIAWWNMTVMGQGAHAGDSSAGVSALEKAFSIYEALSQFREERTRRVKAIHPLYAQYAVPAPVCVGRLEAGHYRSGVPEFARLFGTIGTVPGEEVREVIAQFESAVESYADNSDHWLSEHKPLIEWVGPLYNGTELDSDHDLVKVLLECRRLVTGNSCPPVGFQGGCDMCVFMSAGQIPTVIYGPGEIAQGHKAGEFVNERSLLNATKVIALTMLQWCGVSRIE